MQVDAPLREFLAKTPFFGGLLGSPVMDRLIEMLRTRPVKRGEIVLREGETGNSMYIVRTGTLHAYRHCADGGIVEMLLFRPGDFVGVTSLIDMESRPFSIRAETDCELLELSSRDLYSLYKEDLKAYVLVLQNINRELVRRLRKAGVRIAQLSQMAGLEKADPENH